jgi:hypothetical protein
MKSTTYDKLHKLPKQQVITQDEAVLLLLAREQQSHFKHGSDAAWLIAIRNHS